MKVKVGGVRPLHSEAPYLHVVDSARRTHGKGATEPTLFGVLGRAKIDPYMTSLQDLVMNTKADAPVPDELMKDKMLMHHHMNTDRHIISAPPKTHIAGIHHGQVPYAGRFM